MKIFDIPQSGKRGINVSQNGRYGQISRALVIPANPQTQAQQNIRSKFAAAATGWDNLTEAQRTAWVNAAAQRQTKPRCGQSGPMTGLQFYVEINATLAIYGLPTVDTPPATPQFPQLAPQNLVISNVGNVVTLKLTCPADPGTNTCVDACSPCKPGIRVNKNYRAIGVCPAPVQGAADITAQYTAEFGAPVAGQKVFVRACTMVNGFKSVPAVFSGIVPAST